MQKNKFILKTNPTDWTKNNIELQKVVLLKKNVFFLCFFKWSAYQHTYITPVTPHPPSFVQMFTDSEVEIDV